MIKRSSQTLCAWFVASDLLVTAAAWLAAYWIRFESGWFAITKTAPTFDLCLANVPLLLVLAVVAYRLVGQYQVHRLRRFREEMVAVAKGGALLSLLVMGATFYTQDGYESRATMLIFTGLTITFILINRRLSWTVVKHLRRQGYNLTNVIIIGTGRTARKTARALRHASWMGFRTIGFVDDRSSDWSSDLNLLGTTADLPALIEKYRVEHVFIALPLNRYSEARKVFDILSQKVVEVRLVADVPYLAGVTLTTSNLDGLPVVGLRESPHFGLNVVVKRVMDFTLSLIGLILLAPLFALVAAAIKITSPGPVFYRQVRCGLNGKPFHMFKFRTMRVDAEAGTGPVMTAENDPRRTKLGTFFRMTSIDELPQLINVLIGDMSLVGPRPERPHFIQEFTKTIPNYMARHSVKCGITGWAQLHGWRGNTSLRKRIQFDLYYITHWNPWLDLRILVMTVVKMLFHRHAY
ncbi:undecaprenyl-phosphate glucose phosphotransferase [Tuwongella immobilis]|uniref:Bacterial sugar transferase domain-containing protein n=1 Tax=Tuwongella immobilis TaxID=692036 RepID=A0A6C2YMJ3_9BACT|nr:undecaprenyl-phosphate glucose phosphotransferase [Tuwongella immobilis]VIP02343.1 Sugar transferase OS=uncultured planctomycete GN=HGMM_F16E03C02 PE=4 SV=1: CoA_binding_3: Bac_transf [Tuwongella immobilis]VTS01115.1 Sugar transferase OS=uncultured planctomycete GN=HGMM_F16E03C02 PE=4 SV=1: CoA_binding_3: Bac_transf [Tuwongella immobilis]